MKLSKIVISAFALAMIMLASCSKSNDALIVGKWKISDMSSKDFDISKLPAEQKAMIEEKLKQMKDSSSFEAKSDGTYHNSIWSGQKYESDGKWAFTADGKQLVITDGPKVDTFNVTISSDKMEWESEGNKITYVK